MVSRYAEINTTRQHRQSKTLSKYLERMPDSRQKKRTLPPIKVVKPKKRAQRQTRKRNNPERRLCRRFSIGLFHSLIDASNTKEKGRIVPRSRLHITDSASYLEQKRKELFQRPDVSSYVKDCETKTAKMMLVMRMRQLPKPRATHRRARTLDIRSPFVPTNTLRRLKRKTRDAKSEELRRFKVGKHTMYCPCCELPSTSTRILLRRLRNRKVGQTFL